jgi:hypothetical protein
MAYVPRGARIRRIQTEYGCRKRIRCAVGAQSKLAVKIFYRTDRQRISAADGIISDRHSYGLWHDSKHRREYGSFIIVRILLPSGFFMYTEA